MGNGDGLLHRSKGLEIKNIPITPKTIAIAVTVALSFGGTAGMSPLIFGGNDDEIIEAKLEENNFLLKEIKEEIENMRKNKEEEDINKLYDRITKLETFMEIYFQEK